MKSQTPQHSTSISKREDKKSVNIKWNSGIFFQIGIIISILSVFLIAESSIGSTTITVTPDDDFYLSEPTMTTYRLEEPVKSVPIRKKPKTNILERKKLVPINDKINIVDNHTTDIVESNTQPVDNSIASEKISVTKEVPETTNKNYNTKTVEFVPIYPGCESLMSNQERVACMSSKINKFISRKFNTQKFSESIERGELQRIVVQFTIDASGNVTDIKARSKHKPLEKEAIRVLEKLPLITPGKQGERKVDVIYSVPIIFKMGY